MYATEPTGAAPAGKLKGWSSPLFYTQEKNEMRYLLLALPLLLGTVTTVEAQVSVGVSIGINVPVYPQLVRMPGYPVYYDPRGSSNYFFYDGLYWVFRDDNWYSSGWYNGPWQAIDPVYVPLFVLRIPVRYYRNPPSYFRGWAANAPPRWGEHWGGAWQQRRAGWDQWNRRAVPAAAPLPSYQRQYSGARYPHAVEQQRVIRAKDYRYQPREAVSRQQFHQQVPAPIPASRTQQEQRRPQQRMTQPQAQHPQAEQQRPQKRTPQPHPQPQAQHPPAAPQRQAPPVRQPMQPPAQPPRRQPEQQHQPQGARPASGPQRARPEPQKQGQRQGQERNGSGSQEQDRQNRN
jgi:hypothetical protein